MLCFLGCFLGDGKPKLWQSESASESDILHDVKAACSWLQSTYVKHTSSRLWIDAHPCQQLLHHAVQASRGCCCMP
jgi:hypothetical protein